MAGLAGESGHADGSGNAARFNSPYGIAVGSAGNAYHVKDLRDSKLVFERFTLSPCFLLITKLSSPFSLGSPPAKRR